MVEEVPVNEESGDGLFVLWSSQVFDSIQQLSMEIDYMQTWSTRGTGPPLQPKNMMLANQVPVDLLVPQQTRILAHFQKFPDRHPEKQAIFLQSLTEVFQSAPLPQRSPIHSANICQQKVYASLQFFALKVEDQLLRWDHKMNCPNTSKHPLR